MNSQEEKAKAIGGGESPDYIDISMASWRCGCYEDQHGYHLCTTHLKDAVHSLVAAAASDPPPQD